MPQTSLRTLRNATGMTVTVTSYGAAITSICVPDAQGRITDVVLGFDDPASYHAHTWYSGAIIGRYAGRIRGARFTLDGADHSLSANHGPHHLHGGARGFSTAVWQWDDAASDEAVTLRHISPDGDQGYPGTVHVTVTYTLTDDGDLVIDLSARSDRATHINLTNHAYFNLAGAGDVLAHELAINARAFAIADDALIPTGTLARVDDTPFDFTEPVAIGARIEEAHPQLRIARGYDHDFLLNDRGAERFGARFAARLRDPLSGRVLEVFTTQPVLHVYSGNFIPPDPPGRGGVRYGLRAGIALETQSFSDAPNLPQFPSTVLRPDAEHRARTIFRFSAGPADV